MAGKPTKYKVTAVISWEIKCPEGKHPDTIAQNQLNKVTGGTLPENMHSMINLKKLKVKKSKIIWGEFEPDAVLEHVTSSEERKIYQAGGKNHSISMDSHRYFIFAASRFCTACNLEGTKMILEQHPNDKAPHFNLYGEEDNELVMLTKDHILPKSVNGGDTHSNYQTMCEICNNLKGSKRLSLESIRNLRDLRNSLINNDNVSKKSMSKALTVRKNKLPAITFKKRHTGKEGDIFLYDVLVIEKEEGLVGISIYDGILEPNQIACIQQGMRIVPLRSCGNVIVFPYDKRELTVHKKYIKNY